LAVGTEGLVVEVNLDAVVVLGDDVAVDGEAERADYEAGQEEGGFHGRIIDF
jgi:hypothetical protein